MYIIIYFERILIVRIQNNFRRKVDSIKISHYGNM